MIEIPCDNCGTVFKPSESNIKNCSQKCGYEGRTKRYYKKKVAETPAASPLFLPEYMAKSYFKDYQKPLSAPFDVHPINSGQGDFRIGKRILVIPDTQVKPGHDQSHLEWIGRYIEEKRPDYVVHLGDHWDMESLCSYDKGKRSFEGRRYVDDIRAGNYAMDLLTSQYRPFYTPIEHFFLGNHEERIERAADLQAELTGLISYDDLSLDGWVVHAPEEVSEIEGVKFAHYFTSGLYNKPVSSAAVMLKIAQGSAVQGHAQKVDIAIHEKSGSIAMMAGICYLHDEDYLGPQGNNCRRQIVMLNEVKDGIFDPMFISLSYLRAKYGDAK